MGLQRFVSLSDSQSPLHCTTCRFQMTSKVARLQIEAPPVTTSQQRCVSFRRFNLIL